MPPRLDDTDEEDGIENEEVGLGEDQEGADDAREEGQGDEEDGDEGQEAQVVDDGVKPSRATSAVRTAKERAREAERARQQTETQLQTLQREIAELKQARNAPQQETQEQEAARLALMTTDERVEYRLAKAEARHNATLQQLQRQNVDAADRAEFLAKATTDKLVTKYAPRVEERLKELRAQGQNVSRDLLMTFLIGEDARKAAGTVGKQRDEGRRAVARQTTRASSGRSDQPARGTRRGGNSFEDLYGDTPI